MNTVQGITVKEAACLLGKTRIRVWQLIHEGKLIAQRFGRMWSIQPGSLKKHMEEVQKERARRKSK